MANLVLNPGFETGDFTNWLIDSGAVIDNSNTHSGGFAAQLPPAVGVYQIVTGLTPNTTYQLTGWGKMLVLGTPGDSGFIGVKNYGFPQVLAPIETTEWTKVTLTFTTGPTNTEATVWGFPDSGTQVVDDYTLELVVPLSVDAPAPVASGGSTESSTLIA